MTFIFNLSVIGFVLLIAYWWANQGTFSAFLHLLAVVGAGIIAIGLWEPVAYLLLRGNTMDSFAWGVSLIGLFSISLFLLRYLTDKLCPSNVNLPTWVNWTLGGALGGGAGILTIGILLIGAGFVQSHKEIIGFRHYGRKSNGSVSRKPLMQMWLPVDQMTSRFFSFISRGSLYPTFNKTPLSEYNPHLNQQAWLLRDTHNNGQSQLSLVPGEAAVESFYYEEDADRCAVAMVFRKGARDFREQLILSASQVRLICSPRGSREARTIHPNRWVDDMGLHNFDNPTHYISSEPGKEEAHVNIQFPLRAGDRPRFIQVKNVRYRLPKEADSLISAGMTSVSGTSASFNIDLTKGSIQQAVDISNSIRPVRVSTNHMPSGMNQRDRYLTQGKGEFINRGGNISRKLTILGITEPEGTRIVKVDVSRNSSANIYGAVRDAVSDNAPIYLTDDKNNRYTPIGYMYRQTEKTIILLHPSPSEPFRRIKDMPPVPSTGDHSVFLLFEVTVGSTITSLQVEPETVGICNVFVPARQD